MASSPLLHETSFPLHETSFPLHEPPFDGTSVVEVLRMLNMERRMRDRIRSMSMSLEVPLPDRPPLEAMSTEQLALHLQDLTMIERSPDVNITRAMWSGSMFPFQFDTDYRQ